MADCVCGHAERFHSLQGACVVHDCPCGTFRANEVIPGTRASDSAAYEALRELVDRFNPVTESERQRLEAQRPHGKCPRCGEEHLLDPLGIATHCIAVQGIDFLPGGAIAHIEFGTISRPGIIQVSGISGDTFRQFSEMHNNLLGRVESLENRIKAQADEPICKCGHGLGNHDSDDNCNRCSCRTFRNIFA
jgi:hypothetical protein